MIFLIETILSENKNKKEKKDKKKRKTKKLIFVPRIHCPRMVEAEILW